MNSDVLVATAALFALASPRRFPMRTAAATLKAYGAWNVVDADTRRTDCAARVTGPKLKSLSQLIVKAISM